MTRHAVTGDVTGGGPTSRPVDIATARAAYERFRPLYPKPPDADPRQPAEAEFLRLVLREGVDPERIIAAVEPFRRALARDRIEPRYVPGSARWLRERRFEDLQPAVAQPPPETAADPWLVPVLARLAGELGGDVVAAWFSRLAVVRRTAAGVELAAPSRIAAARIEEQYRDRLRAAVAAVHGPLRITVTAGEPGLRMTGVPP